MHRFRAALAAALVLASFSCSGDDGPTDEAEAVDVTEAPTEATEEEEEVELRAFVTRPDLTPPVIEVMTSASSASSAPGFLFLAPKQTNAQTGPLIVDDEGELVWSSPAGGEDSAADFRVQTYGGEPVLTWWEGRSHRGWGEGEFVIADSSYREIARLAAGNGRHGDLHELQLTEEGTALVLVYEKEPADLTAFGGPEDGYHFENYVQEIDIATGELLFEWAAGDHVDMDETFVELDEDEDGSEEGPFDWFHVNSAEADGDVLLVSARNTHAVYAIDRATGEVRWRLGGKESDFEMGEGTIFAWQHDARRLADGTLSLFDNQANPPDELESRGLVLALDEAARTATLVRELRHPDEVRSRTQGNTQLLPGGGWIVGWGNQGRVSEFAPDGTLVYDATWAPADSYRVYRFDWAGQPTAPPDVVVQSGELYVSWNGATEVAEWRVLGGDDPGTLQPITTVPKDGFETKIPLGGSAHVAVEALDAEGKVLGTSKTVTTEA